MKASHSTQIYLSIMVCLLTVIFFMACQDMAPENSWTKLETRTLQHQGNDRKYTVHLPNSYVQNTSLPVVLVLHGGGGTMAATQTFTQMNKFSDKNDFAVVYPEGFAKQQNGFSWADGRNTIADQQGIDDVGFIEKLVDLLLDEYRFDVERIYICGFSNGGFMTQRLACELNDRFAAMGSLGRSMDVDLITTCKPGRAIPMLLLTGSEDPFVPIEGGEMIGFGNVKDIVAMDDLVNFWVKQNGCDTEANVEELPNTVSNDRSSVTLIRYNGCACGSDVRYYRINGGGHTWPGISLPPYEVIAGPTNLDIHASQELWTFFEDKRRCL